MPTAYSYIRFSSREQREGRSTERQLQSAQRYCADHGLTLDTKLKLLDEGKSGWTGENIKSGALGKFLELVRQGKIAKGSYLLIENLDRLSRMKPRDAQKIFYSILDSGINIVSLMDGKTYTKENSNDMMDMVISIMHMSLANLESEKGLKDNWMFGKPNGQK